jgi:hypothetical protein
MLESRDSSKTLVLLLSCFRSPTPLITAAVLLVHFLDKKIESGNFFSEEEKKKEKEEIELELWIPDPWLECIRRNIRKRVFYLR